MKSSILSMRRLGVPVLAMPRHIWSCRGTRSIGSEPHRFIGVAVANQNLFATGLDCLIGFSRMM